MTLRPAIVGLGSHKNSAERKLSKASISCIAKYQQNWLASKGGGRDIPRNFASIFGVGIRRIDYYINHSLRK
jgi:hypothetical protein